jgi:PleD family two-component response regulator
MVPGKKHAGQIPSRVGGQEKNSRTIIDRNISPGKNVYSMEAGIKILYVDDEPNLLEIGRLFLEEENGNFQVFTSPSARDALGSLQILSYDIIISDYQMSGMNGITLLKKSGTGTVISRSSSSPAVAGKKS